MIQEICPHCDFVNDIVWDGISRTTICQDCGEEILLCCLCDSNTSDCANCKYELSAGQDSI